MANDTEDRAGEFEDEPEIDPVIVKLAARTTEIEAKADAILLMAEQVQAGVTQYMLLSGLAVIQVHHATVHITDICEVIQNPDQDWARMRMALDQLECATIALHTCVATRRQTRALRVAAMSASGRSDEESTLD